MKNIIKKLNILIVLAIFLAPSFSFAQYGYDDWGYDYNSGYDDWSYDYGSGYDDWSYNYNSGYDDWSYNYNSGYDDWSYDYNSGYDDWSYDYNSGYDDWSYDYNSGYDDWSYDYNSGYDDWSYDYNSGYDDWSYNYNSGYDDWGYDYNTGYDDWAYDYNTGYDDWSYDYNSGYDDWSYDYNTGYDDWGYDYNTGYDDWAYDYNTGYDDWGYDYNTGYDDWAYDYNTGYDDWGYDYNVGYDDWDYDYTDYGYNYDYGNDYDYDYNYAYSYDYDYNGGYYGYNGYNGNYIDYGYYYDYDYDYDCKNCGGGDIIVISELSLEVDCIVSDTNIEEGDNVTYTASVSGGKGKFTYNWSGDVNSSSRVVNKTYNNDGEYRATITVRDSRGNTATDVCSLVVVDTEVDNDEDLGVVCKVSDTNIEEGDTVTYTADTNGGSGNITYNWNGDVNSSSRVVTKTYNNEGDYRASVTVRDSRGNADSDECPTVVVEDNDNDNDDLNVVCRVSDTSIDEGDRVTFTAEVRGGDSPFDYDWRGDVDGDDRSVSKKFRKSGRYDVSVKVTDDEGNTDTADCSTIKVDDEDDDDDDDDNSYVSRIFDYPAGGSSVSSVFLNQIPNTGPVDTLKGIGIIGLILLWSFASAYMIRNKMKKDDIAKKIAEFKEINKQKQNI